MSCVGQDSHMKHIKARVPDDLLQLSHEFMRWRLCCH